MDDPIAKRTGSLSASNIISNQRTLLFAFFTFILIYRLYYFNSFLVPDADFFDFREKAISFIDLKLPSNPKSYERLPFYPSLMGFLSLVLPGREPILLAAELINLIGSILCLLLVYLISSEFIGRSAFFVVLLFAFHPLTNHMTIQPRAEMLTLVFLLLGIRLSLSDRYASYLCAFLAALTRYEGTILILSLLTKDVIFHRRRSLVILLGFLSSLGIMAWLYLNHRATGHLNPYYNYFGSEIGRDLGGEVGLAALRYVKLKVAGLLNFIPSGVPVRKAFAVLVLILGTTGFYSFFKRSFKKALPLFLFLFGHLLVHFIYFALAKQHLFLILWICYLTVVGGIRYIAVYIEQSITEPKMYELQSKAMFYSLILVLTATALFLGRFSTSESPSIGFWVTYVIPSIFIIWFTAITYDSSRLLDRFLIIVLIPVLNFVLERDIILTHEGVTNAIYTKAELRLVGEWYSENVKDGEKMVVTEPRVPGYYADLLRYTKESNMPISGHYSDDYGNLIFLGGFRASSHGSFISELRDRGITYVVWNSHHRKYDENSYYSRLDKRFLISDLRDGRDRPNFKLIKTLRAGPSYAFIYRFVP
jgi:hypothetical protein